MVLNYQSDYNPAECPNSDEFLLFLYDKSQIMFKKNIFKWAIIGPTITLSYKF